MKINPIKTDDSHRLPLFLAELCELLMEKGAADAEIFSVDEIEFNDPDREGDLPNESDFSPNLKWPRDSIQDMLRAFDKAVVFRVGRDNHSYADETKALKKVYEIASKAEAHCFYNGFHLAVGLGAGDCREVFCKYERDCQSMTPGRGCRHPLAARPSVEGCGIKIPKIMKSIKWKANKARSFYLGMIFVD